MVELRREKMYFFLKQFFFLKKAKLPKILNKE